MPLILPVFLCASLLGISWYLRRGRDLVLLAALLMGGMLRYRTAAELFPAAHIHRAAEFGQEVQLEGRVRGEPEAQGDRVRLVLDLVSLRGQESVRSARGRVQVTIRGFSIDVDNGDYMTLSGRLQRPRAARNPGDFDQRKHLFRQGIHAILSVRDSSQVEVLAAHPGAGLHELLVGRPKQAFRRVIRRHLDEEPAALLQGLLLGDRHVIPTGVTDDFRATGLAHVLVISGLHTGLVGVLVFKTLASIRCSESTAAAGTMLVLGFFAVLTGMSIPVVRAALTAGVVLGGRALGRNGDVYNSLGVSALVILGIWPQSLFGTSFQLSFAATLSIVALHRPLLSWMPRHWTQPERRCSRMLWTPLAVSLAAQLGTAPLTAWHFQHLAPLAPMANLMAVPLLAAAVSLGLAGVTVGAVWAPAALPFLACNRLVLSSMLLLARWLATLPGASVALARPGIPFALVWGLSMVLAGWYALPRRARFALLLLLLGSANLALWSHVLTPPGLEVVFLDVGQGDAAFIRLPNRRTMLVDGGNRSPYFDYGERVILPYLRRRGVRRLDAVIATHPHSDHIGGLVSVIEQVQVGWYLDNGQHSDTWAALRLRELVRERGIHYQTLSAGDSLTGTGGAGVLILHPSSGFVSETGPAPANVNNGSVVVRLTFGSHTVLFTGDMENRADPHLLAWNERLQACVLKVAHHGSITSTSPQFLAAVSPRLAVISVGAGNRFGHPDPIVVRRLRQHGMPVWRTDHHGAITLRVGAGRLDASTMVAGKRYILKPQEAVRP